MTVKITRGTARRPEVFVQERDVAEILFGRLADTAPDALYDELAKHASTNEGQTVIIVPTAPIRGYGFCYRFTHPDVVKWIGQQSWIMELAPLVKLGRQRLIKRATSLEASADYMRTMLVLHPDDFSEQETKQAHIMAERLEYKAASMRIVCGELEGRYKMLRPLAENICQALLEPVNAPA